MSTIAFARRQIEVSPITLAAWAAIAGGVLTILLGFPLAHLQASSPIPATILGLNAVSHLLLIAGLAGLARSGAAGRGGLARGGLALALVGLSVLTVAEATATVTMTVASALYGLATLLMAVGLVMTGAAVLRFGRWSGWKRFTPLACGLFIPLVLMPAFALPGFAAHYAIGLWGGGWVLFGMALLSEGCGG